MEAPKPTDSSQTTCFPTSKRKPAFSTRSGFCIDFGTRLAPFWHHFGMEMGEKNKKIASEPASKNNRFFEWFFDRFFLTILASILDYLSESRAPKNRIWALEWAIWGRLGHFVPIPGPFWPIWDQNLELWNPFGKHFCGFGAPFSTQASRFRALASASASVSWIKFQDLRFKIQNSRFKIQDSKFNQNLNLDFEFASK